MTAPRGERHTYAEREMKRVRQIEKQTELRRMGKGEKEYVSVSYIAGDE